MRFIFLFLVSILSAGFAQANGEREQLLFGRSPSDFHTYGEYLANGKKYFHKDSCGTFATASAACAERSGFAIEKIQVASGESIADILFQKRTRYDSLGSVRQNVFFALWVLTEGGDLYYARSEGGGENVDPATLVSVVLPEGEQAWRVYELDRADSVLLLTRKGNLYRIYKDLAGAPSEKHIPILLDQNIQAVEFMLNVSGGMGSYSWTKIEYYAIGDQSTFGIIEKSYLDPHSASDPSSPFATVYPLPLGGPLVSAKRGFGRPATTTFVGPSGSKWVVEEEWGKVLVRQILD